MLSARKSHMKRSLLSIILICAALSANVPPNTDGTERAAAMTGLANDTRGEVTLNVLGIGATAITGGRSHTCALTTDGGVKCWGSNDYGQLGDGTTTHRSMPVNVTGLGSGVAAIAAGESFTCALTTGGGVKCWGWNVAWQLGDGTTTNRSTPVNVIGLSSGVAAIALGWYHACALTTAGGVKCWGHNDSGQLGDGTTTNRSTPVDVTGLDSGVAAIAAGSWHSCALTTAGGAKCWGWNGHGQLGDGTSSSKYTPIGVSGLSTGVAAIVAGQEHTCALTTDGGAKCWGESLFGQLGNGGTTRRTTPDDVTGLGSGVAAIAVGGMLTCALTTSGGIKCWGDNSYGQLGDGTDTARYTPVDVTGLGSGVAAISVSPVHACALMASGGAKCWGANTVGQLGNGTTNSWNTSVDVTGLGSGMAAIAAGVSQTCAVNSGGGVMCWGDNYYGQVGDGTNIRRSTPVAVTGLGSGVAAIAAGSYHTCNLATGGGVKCWGYNLSGQLGNGTSTNRKTPVDVTGLGSGVIAIAAGAFHTCALTSGGGAKCWGSNAYSQLGDGTSANRYAPVNVTGLESGVAAIAAGGRHTCALTSSGGVKCWGSNGYGQLGDGTNTQRSTSVDVAGLGSGVVAITAGEYHTCALTSASGVKCWGYNSSGRLGDGTSTNRSTPVDVTGLGSVVSSIAAGGPHTCALTAGGGVKCWGDNTLGQLGDGTTSSKSTPVGVTGLGSGVATIAAGGLHSCALTHGGGVKCWGDNTTGQLGTNPGWTPADVSGLAGITCDPQDTTDTDGDGLLDTWEVCGYDANLDGVVDVNLPALGARPFHKDIFVEIDYMVDPGLCTFLGCVFGHSHRPKPEAIAIVVQSFARAPVSNPDGSLGISLHVEVDNSISHRNHLATSGENWKTALNRLKDEEGRFISYKKAIYHYALFAHYISEAEARYSGVSANQDGPLFDLGASDFLVSLGGSLGFETVSNQAGTFMHELGHNLGLRHGGADELIRKPNYLSVMNYSFQNTGLRYMGADGLFDYSRFGNIPSLDENHLNEAVGLNGGSAIEGYGTRWGCTGLPGILNPSPTVDNANGQVNWDCGLVGTGEDVRADINADTYYSVLLSSDDWSRLVFDGGAIGLDRPGSSARLSRPTSDSLIEELTIEEDAKLIRQYRVALRGGGEVVASISVTTTSFITVANLGALTTTVAISRDSGGTWFDLSSLPVSVTLAPSMSIAYPLTMTVPATRSTQITSSAAIWATPLESPLMGDVARLNAMIGPLARYDAAPVRGFGPYTVTFSDASIGQIASRVWSFGDGFTSTVVNPSHFYAVPGVYTATLAVMGPDGTDVTTGASRIEMVLLRIFVPMALR